jgi:hypothetical protein
MSAVQQPQGAMHVATTRRHYTGRDGTRHDYEAHLLRRSYRDGQGRSQKETLANLSQLPPRSIDAIRKTLAGKTLVDAESEITIERSLAHGDVAAVCALAQKLGITRLLGPECRQRDLAFALIISRVVRPGSKLSTAGWWNDTTLGEDLGITSIDPDDAYDAMDWLLARQDDIESQLARRHITPGGIAMFDLSSSWVEGRCCELAAGGYSRDGKRGTLQVEYGLLTDPEGRPVAVRVFPGNTSDSKACTEAISVVRDKFGLEELILVGDRGMLTTTRIKDLRGMAGMSWITALRAPQIAALAADDGPLQMSLFDEQNFAEITHQDYPGERLVCCRNPLLAEERARKRGELLDATESDLEKIAARVRGGRGRRLKGKDAIGLAVGKVINKRKVAKHFILDIADDAFTWSRDTGKIEAERELDGIYVIRTPVKKEVLGTAGTVAAYKNLSRVERDFRTIKVDDLDLRPIFHYLANRVRAHILICMLAAYVVWHLRRALAPLTFTDEDIPEREDPVSPAPRSTAAKTKECTRETGGGLLVMKFQDLLDHLGSLRRENVVIAGQSMQKITIPTPVQRRAFELIKAPVPVTLPGTRRHEGT